MNPRPLGVFLLYLPLTWSYLSPLGFQCAPAVPGSCGLNNGLTVEIRRRLLQLEAIGDVHEGSTASEGRGFMGSRRARKTGKGNPFYILCLFLNYEGEVHTNPCSENKLE